jgi:hypothetical protein
MKLLVDRQAEASKKCRGILGSFRHLFEAPVEVRCASIGIMMRDA